MLFWGAVFVWLNFEVWILTRNIQVWILYNRLDSIILGLIKIYDGIFGKGCIFKDIRHLLVKDVGIIGWGKKKFFADAQVLERLWQMKMSRFVNALKTNPCQAFNSPKNQSLEKLATK